MGKRKEVVWLYLPFQEQVILKGTIMTGATKVTWNKYNVTGNF